MREIISKFEKEEINLEDIALIFTEKFVEGGKENDE